MSNLKVSRSNAESETGSSVGAGGGATYYETDIDTMNRKDLALNNTQVNCKYNLLQIWGLFTVFSCSGSIALQLSGMGFAVMETSVAIWLQCNI